MKKALIFAAMTAMIVCLLSACGKDDQASSNNQVAKVTYSSIPESSETPTQTKQQVKIAIVKGVDEVLNIREEASLNGAVLGQAQNGDKFRLAIDEEKDGWYQIIYNSSPAFVSAEFITIDTVGIDELESSSQSENSKSSEASSGASSENSNSSVVSSSATESSEWKPSAEDGEAL